MDTFIPAALLAVLIAVLIGFAAVSGVILTR